MPLCRGWNGKIENVLGALAWREQAHFSFVCECKALYFRRRDADLTPCSHERNISPVPFYSLVAKPEHCEHQRSSKQRHDT